MKKRKTRGDIFELIKKIIGMILILFGIISLFLPVLPGILLIVIGAALFSNKSVKKLALNLMGKVKKKKENA